MGCSSDVKQIGPGADEQALITAQKDAAFGARDDLAALEPQLQAIAQREGWDDKILQQVEENLFNSLVSGEKDPVLEDELAKARAGVEGDLAQRLGPNFLRSTAGIQTAGRLATGEAIARAENRKQSIGLFGQLAGQRRQTLGQEEIGRTGTLLGIGGRKLGLIPGFQAAAQPLQQQRAQAQAIENKKTADKNARTGAGLGLLGTAAGFALGGPIGGALGGQVTKTVTDRPQS